MLGEAFEVRATDAAAAFLVEDAIPRAVEVFGAATLAGAGAEVVRRGTFLGLLALALTTVLVQHLHACTCTNNNVYVHVHHMR